MSWSCIRCGATNEDAEPHCWNCSQSRSDKFGRIEMTAQTLQEALKETSMNDLVRGFLKFDRQWPRHLRIAHAKMQLKKARKAGVVEECRFWQAIVDANGTTSVDQFKWYYNIPVTPQPYV